MSAPRTVDLPGGARIEYVEVGEGAPVAYFHGAGGLSRDAAFMSMLGQRYRMLAPSRPGTSASARDEAAEMAEFIRAKVPDGPVHVIAESAGGPAGCWLAVLEPALVKSLILVAP